MLGPGLCKRRTTTRANFLDASMIELDVTIPHGMIQKPCGNPQQIPHGIKGRQQGS